MTPNMSQICDKKQAPVTLTDAKIAKLKSPKLGYVIHWDGNFDGRFGARVTEAGGKAWVLDYTTDDGKRRRLTLGAWPDLSEAAARQEASLKAAEVRAGKDPLADRQRIKIELDGAPTMADLMEDWMEYATAKPKRPSSLRNDKAAFANHILQILGEQTKVADVTWAAVDRLHRQIVKRGTPIQANRVVALLSAAFGRAVLRGWRKDNPAKGIERRREHSRERYLTLDEMERLQAALAESRNRRSAQAVLLLIATGARRGEVLSATWSQFDLEAGVWTKPSSHTKQKRLHMVPLNALALRVLRDMHAGPRGDSPYLFPGEPGQPQQDLKKFWHRIRTLAGIPDVRLHDLRHTFASYAVAKGLPLYTVGKLLGHSNAATTQKYAHLDLTPLREATDAVGEMLSVAK